MELFAHYLIVTCIFLILATSNNILLFLKEDAKNDLKKDSDENKTDDDVK